MPRITDHETNEANRAVEINCDARDTNNGNASHEYSLRWPSGEVVLKFQHGPIAEVGVNGITNEALLAVLIDRMRGFQTSKYQCRENACALTKLEEALHWLHDRTRKREKRGVEGTHAV